MVNFSKNWNNKLDWGIIPTWRLHSQDKYFYYEKLQHKLQNININGKIIHQAYLWDLKVMKLNEIPDYMKIADTGLTPKEFDDLMEKMYSKKPGWHGAETLMIGLFFIKKFM